MSDTEHTDSNTNPNAEQNVAQNAEQNAAPNAAASKHAFQAEVRQVLDIVVHSLYKDRDIFIRELVSNASDALEKLRHIQLTEKDTADSGASLEINVTSDDTAGTLTIADTGVGFTREELVENIGTIAHSGTKAFLRAIKENGGTNENLIGQFGVGFFSVFMVADQVDIYTRTWRPDGESLHWSCAGGGDYTVEPAASDEKRGARIVIRLKPEYKDFASADRVKELLLRYSKYVPVPLHLNGEKLNTVQALWLKNKSGITEEEYKEFYKFQCHAYDEPLDWLHFNADAPLLINALLYFPASNAEKAGFGRMDPAVALHCRKILIDDAPKGLLPDWLRFLRGIADSADLPLNISRETMQDSALVQKLNRVLTKRVIKHLVELATRDVERYEKFWREFAIYIKEGIITDYEYRDALAPLLRYQTNVTDAGKTASLDDYVSRMKESQKAIYYLAGPDRETIVHGPHIEAFKARGLEVLFLCDSADEFVMSHLGKYKDKELLAGDQADLDLGDAPESAGEPLPSERVKTLCEWLKTELGNDTQKLAAVEAGQRLVDSPAVALNADKFMSAAMRRMMRAMGQENDAAASGVKLEINPRHGLIHKLDALRDTDPSFAKLLAGQLFDNALLAAGLLENPRAMTSRIYEILEAAAARKS
ncbi:MAG: molecular chaperone HtpG [Puniceicoccales bacterium]|jgi:molecular chaperone HtpG|nr:molecular chaperone HtpG [Puniceicoccales bacterium]